MKALILVIFTIFSLVQFSNAQNKPVYQLYNKKGKIVSYKKMIKDLSKSDMVFFGEDHNNPISHWMQIEMTRSFYEIKSNKLFFGAEMFENGNQLVMNEYLSGLYEENKMLSEMTQVWRNYRTDYKPLVDFARDKNLRFIATNIPRRYASLINKDGLGVLKDLSKDALAMIGPDLEKYFDPTLKVYAEMASKMGDHVPSNLLNIQASQASKDATMAYFSLKNFKKGDFYFHINGSYHSDYHQGIIWWIHKVQPGLIIKTVTTVSRYEWGELKEEEKAIIANYIIVVVDNMTRTNG